SSRICASAKWPMRHLAMTGMETADMISRIFFGDAMRATPPSARICAGTRSRAMTDTAPAFSAISACLASVTSMMTPPFSISARPVLRRRLVEFPLFWDIGGLFSDERENALGLVLFYSLEKVSRSTPSLRSVAQGRLHSTPSPRSVAQGKLRVTEERHRGGRGDAQLRSRAGLADARPWGLAANST